MLVIALVVLAGAAPYIVSRAPFRDWLLAAALAHLEGTVHSSGATFDWFQPVALYDLEITDRDGNTVLSVPSVAGDTPLWRMIADRSNLGVFRIERPQVEIILREGGSNLGDVLAKVKNDQPQKIDNDRVNRLAGGAAVGIDLVSATVVVRRKNSPRSWDAKNVQFSARIEPARPGEERQLTVAPGRLLDHVAITPEVCEDLLQFVAPTLAKVTRAGGSFSLDLTACGVPLVQPRRGDVAGSFTMHDLTAGPGPMVESVATSFGIADTNQLAHEQVIHFQLQDEKVSHQGFALNVGPMGIATQGTVKLADRSLDIELTVRLPEFQNKTAPLRGALSGSSLTLPIRGTLGKPQIDPRAIRDTGLGVLSGVLDALKGGGKLTPEALQKGLSQGGLLKPAAPVAANGSLQAGTNPPTDASAQPDAAQPDDGSKAAAVGFPILEQLLRGGAAMREPRPADGQAAAPAGEAPAPSSEAPSPVAPLSGDRPILRRARKLLDAFKPPTATPPPASNPTPNRTGPKQF